MLSLKISGLLMFYEEFFMKNVWELASIVARLSCENKYLSRGTLEGHQTRTDILLLVAKGYRRSFYMIFT